ncbi:hypothetical protein [Synechococcus sp. EJ6-Ellesmere]|uniref:hypothetical protein n=1 Tax=Synechococcus sp. EJ6-Ellesmere TaxID=2823734 RepID=UPI0020CC271A|nr:hypothetical protein [Synechococcus sp. EJ6-Ellesmere]MCP9823895.1 hypothetical protein [Synechococcus sp. EJ6-Ellesmere]
MPPGFATCSNRSGGFRDREEDRLAYALAMVLPGPEVTGWCCWCWPVVMAHLPPELLLAGPGVAGGAGPGADPAALPWPGGGGPAGAGAGSAGAAGPCCPWLPCHRSCCRPW